MRFLAGFLAGIVLTVVALAYAFASTTVYYKGTLFQGERVRIKALR